MLREVGFEPTARLGEFVLPMALHRALGSAAASRATEGVAAGLGVTKLLGSPVPNVTPSEARCQTSFSSRPFQGESRLMCGYNIHPRGLTTTFKIPQSLRPSE